MKITNFIKFISNPKGYINQLINLHINNFSQKIKDSDFLRPIEETKPNDIFIVGFPKSGNTWMQSLIAGIQYGIDAEYLPDKLAQEIVPDVHARKFYKRFSNQVFFKSHHLPRKQYQKVIYLVRDGRDAMVSYNHFNKKLGFKFSIEDMVKDGKGVIPCLWHEHIQKWLKNPYNAEIITIKYEDLLTNPLPELRKICVFANIERSDELLNKVIAGNHIEKMRQRVKETGGMGHKAWNGDKGVDFFRKGKSGSYRNEMDSELLKYFNNISKNELLHYGYETD